jgi:hypothetical protein
VPWDRVARSVVAEQFVVVGAAPGCRVGVHGEAVSRAMACSAGTGMAWACTTVRGVGDDDVGRGVPHVAIPPQPNLAEAPGFRQLVEEAGFGGVQRAPGPRRPSAGADLAGGRPKHLQDRRGDGQPDHRLG